MYNQDLNMDYFDYICPIMTDCFVMMFAQQIKIADKALNLFTM